MATRDRSCTIELIHVERGLGRLFHSVHAATVRFSLLFSSCSMLDTHVDVEELVSLNLFNRDVSQWSVSSLDFSPLQVGQNSSQWPPWTQNSELLSLIPLLELETLNIVISCYFQRLSLQASADRRFWCRKVLPASAIRWWYLHRVVHLHNRSRFRELIYSSWLK